MANEQQVLWQVLTTTSDTERLERERENESGGLEGVEAAVEAWYGGDDGDNM